MKEDPPESFPVTPQPVTTLQVTPVMQPSAKAQVGFWLGVVNTGGLMVLGAYCLYGAVEAQHAATAAVVLGGLVRFLPR